VEEGSLYSTLRRLPAEGWVKEEWKTTETNRRARFYTLTDTAISMWASSYQILNR
jgi:PadR family transcriptional regulator, regulatory protein PadR